jgi:hypothetical protein
MLGVFIAIIDGLTKNLVGESCCPLYVMMCTSASQFLSIVCTWFGGPGIIHRTYYRYAKIEILQSLWQSKTLGRIAEPPCICLWHTCVFLMHDLHDMTNSTLLGVWPSLFAVRGVRIDPYCQKSLLDLWCVSLYYDVTFREYFSMGLTVLVPGSIFRGLMVPVSF